MKDRMIALMIFAIGFSALALWFFAPSRCDVPKQRFIGDAILLFGCPRLSVSVSIKVFDDE